MKVRYAIAAFLFASQLTSIVFAAPDFTEVVSRYEIRREHDAVGIGKFYLGREIARVMSVDGLNWLERPERGEQEQPNLVIQALHLHSGEVVVDLGAGSGYFTFLMAKEVGSHGTVLAVDIEPKMLDFIRARAARNNLTNIGLILGTEKNPKLPANRIDLVLLVDVYHELSYPYEVMRNVYASLKPHGRVALVEYRAEDPEVPIKPLHKMSEAQIINEMRAAGFTYLETNRSLPQQHLVLFGK